MSDTATTDREERNMKFGTCHFVSKRTAIAYYANEETVDRKLAAGEIFIGKPPVKEGEEIIVNGKEGRYTIKVTGEVK